MGLFFVPLNAVAFGSINDSKLDEASAALRVGDVKTYRRNVETVVSRLGHLS